MADFSGLRQLLDFRSLGAMYEEFGRRSAPNPFFRYYIGDPAMEASEELNNVLEDEDLSPTAIPMQSAAGGGSVERFDTDTFEYLYLSRIKTMAPTNKRDAPARVMQPTRSDIRRQTMGGMFNQLTLGMDSLRALREPDNWVLQRKGQTEVRKQIQDFATQHSVTKQVSLSKAFTGTIYIGPTGLIQESSSGAEYAISTGVPASNLGSLNITGTNIINGLWSNAATDILLQLDNLRVACEALNVPPPVHIWLNTANKYMLRNNTKMQTYFYGVERLDNALLKDEVTFNNVTFHFFAGTYIASDGTLQYYIPLDKAVITPEIGPWLLHAQGLQYVPGSIDIGGSADEMLAEIQEVYGDFSYAKLEHNPVSLSLFMGSNYYYGFRNPNSVFYPTIA